MTFTRTPKITIVTIFRFSIQISNFYIYFIQYFYRKTPFLVSGINQVKNILFPCKLIFL